MKDTIYDLTQNWLDRDFLINPFLQDAPFFASIPMMETNAKLANVTSKVKDIEVPQVVDFDAPLPQIKVSFEKSFAVLGKVGGILPLGLDKMKLLDNVEAYINQQLKVIINKTGQDFDYSYLYAVVKKFCLDNISKCVTRVLTGQTAETGYYSMIGINMRLGENCGLFSPYLNSNGQGKLFELIVPDNGAVTKIKNEKGQEIYGKELGIQTYLGLQLPRPDRVHALVNIKPSAANGVPSPAQLLDFIAEFAQGDDGDMVFCHPSLINAIRATYMKDNAHADFIRWDNGAIYIDTVRVVPDKNMLKGTEAAVLD